ncbi:MAG: rRNA maturation RNase YbeY [bacterium]
MKINILYRTKFLEDSKQKAILRKALKQISNAVSVEEEKKISELSFVFCNDEFIREYNKTYLGHDYYTDIITFHDTDDFGAIQGELLISTETVETNSVRFKTDFSNELKRVAIHGILHLCGYKDKTALQKKAIRKKENHYLKQTENAGKSN